MATSPVRLPASNPAGNNQTSPAKLGANATGTGTLPFSSQGGGSNPFFQGPPAFSQAAGSNPAPLSSSAAAAASSPGSLYDSSSTYSSGESNIEKQLIDIYGKGVGGMLNSLLAGMSGTDSQIFQQWLASMQPVEASERSQLQGTLGSEGVSGNSSVSAIANSNLTSQFNAQAAGVNSQLMQQQLQDTLDILMGVRGDAAKEVASSGWGVFADVMNNITGDIGNLSGGSYKSSGSNYNSVGSGDASNPLSGTSAPQLSNLQGSAPGGQFGIDNPGLGGSDSIDNSLFDSSAPAPGSEGYDF